MKLSVVLATYNEEKNLAACLESVKSIADEIIIVDGSSTDNTVAIAKKFGAKVTITTNPPIFHINKQKAIDLATKEWILQLDADERVSEALSHEIKQVIQIKNNLINGYWIPRKNWFLGRFLTKGGQYPDYTLRLYKKGKGRLPQKDVHEQAQVDGETKHLYNPLLHIADPYFSRYFMRWNRYTTLMANDLAKEKNSLWKGIQYMCVKPLSWFLLTYIRHKGFMDLWQGFVFSFFSALRFPVSYVKYQRRKSYMSHIGIIVLLVGIVGISFLLRSRMFLFNDFYLLPDQGRDLQLVKEIVTLHKLPLIGGHAGVGGLFHGPLWLYLIAPVFIITGGNPFYSLVPIYLFVSLSLVVGGFFVAKKLYGISSGILFALLIGISSVFITTISFTSNSQVMPLVFLFYLFFFLLYLRGNNKAFFYSIFCIGIGCHFEAAFAVFLIPTTIVFAAVSKKIPSLNAMILGVGIFLVTISNFIIFDLRHGFLMTHTIFSLFTGHIKPSSADHQLTNIGFRMYDRFQWFLASFKSPLFVETSLVMTILWIIILAALVVSVYAYVRTKRLLVIDKEIFLLLGMQIFLYTLYILYPLPLQAHYVQSSLILTILLFILCIKKIYSFLIGKILIGCFFTINILAVFSWLDSNYLKQNTYIPASNGSYLNQIAAVDSIYEDAKGREFGYFVYDTPIVTYGMDYLMWWRGTTKYHVTPVSMKKPLTYLILMPGPTGDKNAHAFWIKNTIRTLAPVTQTKLLQGGITIQRLAVAPNDPLVDPNYYINLTFR